jgi:hypothetical protein
LEIKEVNTTRPQDAGLEDEFQESENQALKPFVGTQVTPLANR